MSKQKPDVRFSREGTIFVAYPVSERGKEWVAENVQTEEWQWIGGGFAVDQHLAADLANHAVEDGLVIA